MREKEGKKERERSKLLRGEDVGPIATKPRDVIYTAWQHGHCSKKDRWKEGGEERRGEEEGRGGDGGGEEKPHLFTTLAPLYHPSFPSPPPPHSCLSLLHPQATGDTPPTLASPPACLGCVNKAYNSPDAQLHVTFEE
ncbi:unnamed protein product [Pleuronectes platessa]|uniref:Uncharacterized protein n=1 Tax=Pleuronectes platessa TaxID=8262 RepID=A0A9N7TYB7_PLEPL|nr:unnamed protein product [Pleuronectes platessa]